jgi:hypothetical protein
VSLTSVFLALAIGVVLGTAALNGPVVDDLNDRLGSLRNSNEQYRDRVDELEKAADSRGEFLRQVAASTLANTMKDRTVVLVQSAGASSAQREGIIKMLQAGGAQITGNITLTSDFTNPKRDEALHDLSSQSVAPGIDLPNSGDGIVTASALLASVLLKGVEVSERDRTTVLKAFLEAGFISSEGKINGQADAVVLLLGSPSTKDGVEGRNKATVELARQFNRVCQYSVAAAASAGGNGDPLVEIREDGGLTNSLSTVDGVSTAEGQLVTAMALVEQFANRAGAYGTGKGAKASAPIIR